jgi:hypothetical protein
MAIGMAEEIKFGFSLLSIPQVQVTMDFQYITQHSLLQAELFMFMDWQRCEMGNPLVRIYDAKTNEFIDREMSDSEFEQHQIDNANAEARYASAQAKTEARQSAVEKLSALGLTEEEIQALIGQ